MSPTNEIPKVSMTNTKKELLEAYEGLKTRYRTHAKDLLDAKNARKEMEKKLSLAEAESQSTRNPIQRLHQLRGDINGTLLELADKFETELDAFKKIQFAVKTRQEDLQTIYGVETAASDLAALIEAQRARKTSFEEEMATARKEWDAETAERERVQKEAAEKIKKERQREKEEFEYHFSREKEQLQNRLDDETLAFEKKRNQDQIDFEKVCQQRTTELDAREQAVEEQQKAFTTLQEQVAAFPKTLENEINTAVKNTRERLTVDFEKSKALLAAKHEGEKNVLLSKLESLERMVDSYQAQMTDLSKRQEQAYEKVQNIANQAVGAAKREYSAPPIVRRDTPET